MAPFLVGNRSPVQHRLRAQVQQSKLDLPPVSAGTTVSSRPEHLG